MTDNSTIKATVNEKWITEGTAAGTTGAAPKDDVTTPSQEWHDLEKKRRLVRDLLGGTEAMQAAGERWLPRWEGEDASTEYKTRLELSELIEFYGQACRGLVNKVFSKPLRLDDAPEVIEQWWESKVSRKATERSGSLYSRGRSYNSVSEGLGFTLVDFPRVQNPAENAADEESRGLMPYAKTIAPECVIEWDEAVDADGEVSVRRVRYADTQEVEGGEWIKGRRPIMVVLDRGERGAPATMQVWVPDKDGKEFRHDPEQDAEFRFRLGSKVGEIPAVRWETGANEGFPALYGLARLNLQHYRKKSDFDNGVAISSQPMKAYIGFRDEDMEGHQVGPYRYVNTSNESAKVMDAGFGYDSGAKIAMEDLAKLEMHIARAAMDPQSTKATGEEKSTIRLIDEAKVSSQLQAWAAGWLEAAQRVLEIAGWWLGIEPEQVGKLSYLEEIFDSLKGQATFQDFLQFAALFTVPEDVAVVEAQRHGVLADDWDADKLAERMGAGELETVPE